MCKLEKTMEEEVEFVSRALSTASFLMAPMPPTEQTVKQKQVWDAASRRVVTITEEAPRKHDLTSVAHAERFQALRQFFESGRTATAEHSKAASSQSGSSLCRNSLGSCHTTLADNSWPEHYADKSTSASGHAYSGHHRSRRNSTLASSHADLQQASCYGSESRHSRKTADKAALTRRSAPLDRIASTAAAEEAYAYSSSSNNNSSSHARSNWASVEMPATPSRASRASADVPGTHARSTRASIDMPHSHSGSSRPSIDIPSLHLSSSSRASLELPEQSHWQHPQDASSALYSATHGKPRASSSKCGGKQHPDTSAMEFSEGVLPGGRVASSRAPRNSVAIMQNQASVQHLTEHSTAVNASPEYRSAPGCRLRRSSVLVVTDIHSQVKSSPGAATTKCVSPQPKSAHSSRSRRDSLVIPQEHPAVRSPAAMSSAAAVADAASGEEYQAHSSDRRDSRPQSLEAFWQETSAISPWPAGPARPGRSASDTPVISKSVEWPKGRGSPDEQIHTAASLAAAGQHAASERVSKSSDAGSLARAVTASAASAGAHPRRTVFDGYKSNAVEDGSYVLKKSKSTPIPSAKHKPSPHKLKRSKTGYLEESEPACGSDRFYSGAGSKSSKKFGSRGLDMKSFKRYVPQISKIDERALQKVGESDCASYASLLDKSISQSLQWL